MLEQFIDKRMSDDRLAIVETANDICAEYAGQGFNLTLRQVYYQFVARGLIANKDQSYKRLGDIINDARLAGLMDWSYIQDRTRNVRGGFGGYRNPGHYIESVADGYIEALWRTQDTRVEVWVEKDALVDIVGRACGNTRTPYFSCRGYVSQSEMYDAAKRFQKRRDQGLRNVVIHLGDHDPSGIDMTRDIRDRLTLMSWDDVEVIRIALNRDQIDRYQPPPNPAKITDSRSTGYIQVHGNQSWELDALEPQVLVDLIEAEIETHLDRDSFDVAIAEENANEDRIRVVADRWADIQDRWDEIEDLLDA